MTKVHFNPDDVKFFYDKNNGITVAKLEGTEDMFIDFIESSSNRLAPGSVKNWNNLYDKLLMPNSFIGKAKCSDGDEFSEEIGHLVAYDRLRKKIADSFAKRMAIYVETVDNMLDSVTQEYNKYIMKVENNENYRDGLIKKFVGEQDNNVSTESK